jgi:hypothetical protein
MELRGGFVSYTRAIVLGTPFDMCFALFVGAAGDVAVRYVDGTTDTLTGLAAGQFYPVRVVEVLAAGTTVPVANLRRAY